MINLKDNKILIVEDEDMNFIYLKQIFKITGGSTDRVKSGLSAIEKCKNNVYDLVLMDIQLPDISGMEATREIRKFNTELLIIAQTAAKTPSELKDIKASGCNHILVKPFKINEFSDLLSNYF